MSNHWSSHLFTDGIKAVVGGWNDPDLSYEFDMRDVVFADGQWHIVQTSGCSCPAPDENAGIEASGTVTDLRTWVLAEFPQDYYEPMRKDVLYALDVADKIGDPS